MIGEGYSLNNLALIYRNLEEYDREVFYFNLCLEVRLRAYKPDSQFVIDTELSLEQALMNSLN